MVSNTFPFQSLAEYPKNCKNNRIVQNIANPSAILLPKLVSIISFSEVIHKIPIKKTVKAIKKV
jgi:hypothetical protein